MSKLFAITRNVGRVRYLVTFHDGVKQHADGSPFYDARTFSNQRECARFVQELVAQGYGER